MTTGGSSNGTSPFRVYQRDSRELRTALLDEGFDADEIDDSLVKATVTSPPYANIKDYGYDEQIGTGDSYDQYLDALREVFKNIYDITRPDGSLWVNINNRQVGGRVVSLQQDLVRMLENLEGISECPKCGDPVRRNGETGELYCTNIDRHDADDEWRTDPSENSWVFQNEIIWDKQKSNDERDGLWNVFEYVLVFKKSEEYEPNPDARIYDPAELKQWWVSDTYNYSPDGAQFANVWDIPAEITGGWAGEDQVEHEAVYPARLVERMIDIATEPGDVVLDPFAGTGTTLAVGDMMDRRTLGFELNPDFIDIHPKRRESVKTELQRGGDEYQSRSDRKKRYQQATWGLRHHNYVKWYMTTLRRQLRDLAEPHHLWADLSTHVDSSWAADVGTALPDAIGDTLAASTPISTLVDEVSQDDASVRLRARALLEPFLDTLEPETILAAFLAELDELPSFLPEGAQAKARKYHQADDTMALAELLTDHADDSIDGLIRVAETIEATQARLAIEAATTADQATLTQYGGQTDGDSGGETDQVLAAGVVVGVTAALTAGEETTPAAIEPLVPVHAADGKLCGLRSVLLVMNTPYGVPSDDEERAGVTHHNVLAPEYADTSDAHQTAFEFITTELDSNNANKLDKHGLDITPNWHTPEELDALRAKDNFTQRNYYLYEGRPERYAHMLDFEGPLWNRLLSAPLQWKDDHCSQSTPAIISPLRLDIQPVTEPEETRYQIQRVNDYVTAGVDDREDDERFTKSFF